VGENRLAAPGLAPDLSAIGVISTPAYLRESIVAASAVLVPSPNPWQHQDRAKGTDARGAWPPDQGFVWFSVEKDGRKTSAMPDFDSLSKEEVADAVAYLMTLGEEPGGRKQP
jgi:mono/diheme cytochrome c family protein